VNDKTAERISSIERRESILAAASRVFGERGYIGATTDQIAQAAGISQPYVVRMFGGKEALFLEVLQRALDKLIVAFRQAIADSRAAGEPEDAVDARIGTAYVDLIEDRGILLSLMQGFIMGHDPVIGKAARDGFLEIYRILRDEAHFEPDRIRGFLADGMLFNTLIALRLPDEYETNDAAKELIECTFNTKLAMVLDVAGSRAVGESA
jgi:TetR/AcrR family transcriptional regulator